MAFTNRRGRPATKTPDRSDLGTPELIKKRLWGITSEALDICLARNLISAEQHWCGIHLRWLYTLRYGVPSVKALDPTHPGGRELGSDNPKWREEREREYHEAIHAIGNMAAVQAVLELCVFNQRPAFLHTDAAGTIKSASRSLAHRQRELFLIHSGLDALVKLWCKRPTSAKRDSPAAQKNP